MAPPRPELRQSLNPQGVENFTAAFHNPFLGSSDKLPEGRKSAEASPQFKSFDDNGKEDVEGKGEEDENGDEDKEMAIPTETGREGDNSPTGCSATEIQHLPKSMLSEGVSKCRLSGSTHFLQPPAKRVSRLMEQRSWRVGPRLGKGERPQSPQTRLIQAAERPKSLFLSSTETNPVGHTESASTDKLAM